MSALSQEANEKATHAARQRRGAMRGRLVGFVLALVLVGLLLCAGYWLAAWFPI